MPAFAGMGSVLPAGLFRHGVEPARMPWMALGQTHGRKHSAFQGAVLTNCVDCIMGAGGVKAAILPKHRADTPLIRTQQQDQQGLHVEPGWFICDWSRRNNSALSSAFKAAVVAGPVLLLTGLDRRTMQSIGGNTACRNSSRVTRLMVLRVTARGAKRLAAMTPKRACANWLARV